MLDLLILIKEYRSFGFVCNYFFQQTKGPLGTLFFDEYKRHEHER